MGPWWWSIFNIVTLISCIMAAFMVGYHHSASQFWKAMHAALDQTYAVRENHPREWMDGITTFASEVMRIQAERGLQLDALLFPRSRV